MADEHIDECKDCTDCKQMVRMGAGVRLLHHLQTSHRFDDKIALALVNWIFDKIEHARAKILEHQSKH
jgi:hypothetical protein